MKSGGADEASAQKQLGTIRTSGECGANLAIGQFADVLGHEAFAQIVIGR